MLHFILYLYYKYRTYIIVIFARKTDLKIIDVLIQKSDFLNQKYKIFKQLLENKKMK